MSLSWKKIQQTLNKHKEDNIDIQMIYLNLNKKKRIISSVEDSEEQEISSGI